MRRLVYVVAFAAACSSKSDGPTPKLDQVQPDPVCVAQKVIDLKLTGSGFSPAVDNGLTSSPTVVLPQVVLVDSAGTTYPVPADAITIPDTTGDEIDIALPQSFVPAGVYEVDVINPNGNRTELASGLTIDPPPTLASISPTSGLVGTTVTLTLTGTGFLPGMTVTLNATPPVDCTGVTVSADGTSATCTLSLTGVTAGVYDLVVDNHDGCTATLTGSFTVISEEFTLLGIDPPFGYMGDETTNVTISSAGDFISTPTAYMTPHGQSSPQYTLKRVAFVDANTITAAVPTGSMPLGFYDLTVTNPPSSGRYAILDNAFQVVSLPIPVIDDVVPSRGPPNTAVALTIYGKNFRSPVTVELLDRTLTVAAMATNGTVSGCAGIECTQIDVTITTPTTQDAYLVRVIDTDQGTYSTFSAFIVGAEGASGNLHTFAPTTTLVTGRRMLAGVSARDDLGNSFIYAIGGDTGGATPTVLKSVEVAQLSKFGGLAAWRQEKPSNDMALTRDAPAAAAVVLRDPSDPCTAPIACLPPLKTYVYVVGGADGATIRGDIERAVVLRNDNAPVMADPVAATGGTLGAGAWYYKVAAICSAAATDPDNPDGESLPSDEAVITLDSAHTAVTLAWTAAPSTTQCHPTGYKVYRTAMADGTSQQELLIATIGNVLTYTDTGAAAGTEPPLPPGALGTWVTETATALGTARWAHQVAVIQDGNNSGASAGSSLYVLGGKSDNAAGYLTSVELSGIDANGHLTGFGTTNATVLPTAIAFFSLVVESPQNVSNGVLRLITLGGVTAAGASNELRFSDVTSGGGNGTWSNYAGAGNPGNRGGDMAVIASNKLFELGGAAMATDTTFSNIDMSGVDVAFTNTGALGTPIQSTANAFPAGNPRALGVPITGAGFIYFVGGTSNGTDAVDTTFQTF